jgi:hypothetical protein
MKSTHMTGKDFEFLITPGDLEIKQEDFDTLMTPDSLPWTKATLNDKTYYKVGKDEFSYSRETAGIQMTFNDAITFEKARKIVEEVTDKLTKHTGKEIEVIFVSIDKN